MCFDSDKDKDVANLQEEDQNRKDLHKENFWLKAGANLICGLPRASSSVFMSNDRKPCIQSLMTQRVSDADTSATAAYITSHFSVGNTTNEVAPISERCILISVIFSSLLPSALLWRSIFVIWIMVSRQWYLFFYIGIVCMQPRAETLKGHVCARCRDWLIIEDTFLCVIHYSPHQPSSLHWKWWSLYPIIFLFFYFFVWASPDVNVVNVPLGKITQTTTLVSLRIDGGTYSLNLPFPE